MRHDAERSQLLRLEDASALDPIRSRLEPYPSNDPGVERSARVPELDALRGLGALTILGFHLWPTTFFFGWTRVDFFFVLSGYLVTLTALRSGPGFRPILAFWARRALRILPAYYVMLAVAAVVATIGGSPPRPSNVISHLFLVQDFPCYRSGTAYRLPGTSQIWSLAVEVQFYMVWPLIVGFVGRSALAPLTLALAADAVAARIVGLDPAVALARCDGLALGSLLALIQDPATCSAQSYRRFDSALFMVGLSALALASAPSAIFDPPDAGILGCTSLSLFAVNAFYFSLVGLTVRYSGHRVLAPLRNRTLRRLGVVSYGIYLYHMIIVDFVRVNIEGRSFLADAVTAVLSILAAIASWKFIERPCISASRTISLKV
jgi:peptidoglycan/LPS O-acetylase OafA/YrhL